MATSTPVRKEPTVVDIDEVIARVEETERFHLCRGIADQGFVDVTCEAVPPVRGRTMLRCVGVVVCEIYLRVEAHGWRFLDTIIPCYLWCNQS